MELTASLRSMRIAQLYLAKAKGSCRTVALAK
jgi:hypothetical protein